MEYATEDCLISFEERSKRQIKIINNKNHTVGFKRTEQNNITTSFQIAEKLFNDEGFNKLKKTNNEGQRRNSAFVNSPNSKKSGKRLSNAHDFVGLKNNLLSKTILNNNFMGGGLYSAMSFKEKESSKVKTDTNKGSSSNIRAAFATTSKNLSHKSVENSVSNKFIEKSKLTDDNTFLSKENNNIKSFLFNCMQVKMKAEVLTSEGNVKPSNEDVQLFTDQNDSMNVDTGGNNNEINIPSLLKQSISLPLKKIINKNDPKPSEMYLPHITEAPSLEDTLDADIEDLDFPLHHEHLKQVDHYIDKYSYKLYRPGRELVRFKNIYDSMSDEEALDIQKWYTINPIGFFKLVWDSLAIILALFNLIAIPYELAFDIMDTNRFYVHLFLDLFFTTDSFLMFFTGYFSDEKVIYKFRKIVKNYYHSPRCYINFISSFPFESFFYIIFPDYLDVDRYGYSQKGPHQKSLLIWKVVRYLKWIELFRLVSLIYKFENLAKGMKKYIHLNLYLRAMLSYLIVLLILIYLASCFWCYLGYRDQSNPELTWLTYYNLTDADNLDIFTCALYYIFTTIFTIGYGDISPTNTVERVYVSILMTIGSVIWSFLLTAFSQVFIINDERTSILNTRMEVLDSISSDLTLSDNLVERIRRSIQYDFKAYKKDQMELMCFLPINLRNELYLSMYKTQITHLKFFKNQSFNFIITVLPLLKNIELLKDEHIITKGDIVKHLYMVTKGVLSVVLINEGERLEISQIKSSFHIGDILMYIDDQCPYDIIVKTNVCNMFVLARSDFAELKMSFKDPISRILLQSYNDYCKIEKIRTQALDYYNQYKTFAGYKLKMTQGMFTSSALVNKAMKKMRQISTQIINDIQLDRKFNKKDILETTVERIKILENLSSKSDNSNDGRRHSFADSSNCGEGDAKKKTSLETIIEVKEGKDSRVSTIICGKNKSNCAQFEFADPVANKNPILISSPTKKFIDSIGVNRLSLPSNKNKIINSIQDRMSQDINFSRNPEIMQSKILGIINQKNIKIVEKQVRRIKKVLYKLNKILILNLRKVKDDSL
jgi:CRP-like cAMP-binding protein